MKECKKAGRAIIIVEDFDGKFIISIKRTKIKNGTEHIYYTIPGGHVENNETFEDTVIREIEEELGLRVKVKEEVIHLFNDDLNKDEKFFLCEIISGELGTGTGPEWSGNIEKYGKYEIVKIPIVNLKDYNLLPDKVKNFIVKNEKSY